MSTTAIEYFEIKLYYTHMYNGNATNRTLGKYSISNHIPGDIIYFVMLMNYNICDSFNCTLKSLQYKYVFTQFTGSAN